MTGGCREREKSIIEGERWWERGKTGKDVEREGKRTLSRTVEEGTEEEERKQRRESIDLVQ